VTEVSRLSAAEWTSVFWKLRVMRGTSRRAGRGTLRTPRGVTWSTNGNQKRGGGGGQKLYRVGENGRSCTHRDFFPYFLFHRNISLPSPSPSLLLFVSCRPTPAHTHTHTQPRGCRCESCVSKLSPQLRVECFFSAVPERCVAFHFIFFFKCRS